MKSVLLVVCGVLLLLMAGDITTPEEMTKGLSRTIEGFTLGMDKDEALAILSGGVKKNNLTVFPGYKTWTRHFSIGGFRYPSAEGFIEPEFYPERM